jgi:hypothetical protein
MPSIDDCRLNRKSSLMFGSWDTWRLESNLAWSVANFFYSCELCGFARKFFVIKCKNFTFKRLNPEL